MQDGDPVGAEERIDLRERLDGHRVEQDTVVRHPDLDQRGAPVVQVCVRTLDVDPDDRGVDGTERTGNGGRLVDEGHLERDVSPDVNDAGIRNSSIVVHALPPVGGWPGP
jgi:hypothetical protein